MRPNPWAAGGTGVNAATYNTCTSDEIAAGLLDELKRGHFSSCNEFLSQMSARIHTGRRSQVIDKLFELGLAHLTDPVAVTVIGALLDA
jgi:hypothetical protein